MSKRFRDDEAGSLELICLAGQFVIQYILNRLKEMSYILCWHRNKYNYFYHIEDSLREKLEKELRWAKKNPLRSVGLVFGHEQYHKGKKRDSKWLKKFYEIGFFGFVPLSKIKFHYGRRQLGDDYTVADLCNEFERCVNDQNEDKNKVESAVNKMYDFFMGNCANKKFTKMLLDNNSAFAKAWEEVLEKKEDDWVEDDNFKVKFLKASFKGIYRKADWFQKAIIGESIADIVEKAQLNEEDTETFLKGQFEKLAAQKGQPNELEELERQYLEEELKIYRTGDKRDRIKYKKRKSMGTRSLIFPTFIVTRKEWKEHYTRILKTISEKLGVFDNRFRGAKKRVPVFLSIYKYRGHDLRSVCLAYNQEVKDVQQIRHVSLEKYVEPEKRFKSLMKKYNC